MSYKFRLDVLVAVMIYTSAAVVDTPGFGFVAGALVFILTIRWDQHAKSQKQPTPHLTKAFFMFVGITWIASECIAMFLRTSHSLVKSGSIELGAGAGVGALICVMIAVRYLSQFVNKNWSIVSKAS